MKELEYTGQAVPKGRRFCTVCGKVKRESSFDADSDHCRECCEKMLHTHLRWYGVVAAVVTAAVLAVTVYIGICTFPIAAQVHTADTMVQQHLLFRAVRTYEEAISAAQARNGERVRPFWLPGEHTWEKYFLCYADAYSEYDAADNAQGRLDRNIAGKNKRLRTLKTAKNIYDAISTEIQKIDEDYDLEDGDDLPYDEIIEKIAAIRVDGDPRYVNGYLEMFKADLTRYCFPDRYDTVIAFYDKALTYLPEEYVLLCSNTAQMAIEAGDHERVVSAARMLVEKNKNFTDAYGWMVDAYGALGQKQQAQAVLDELKQLDPASPLYYKLCVKQSIREEDLDTAKALCDEQNAHNKTAVDATFNTILSQQTLQPEEEQRFLEYIDCALTEAALLLLQDDTQGAFNIAYNYAFNYAYYYDYVTGKGSALTQKVVNMTTLCAELCKGNNDEVDEAKQVLSQVGKCDEETQKVIDGKISLHEAFVEGKVNLI